MSKNQLLLGVWSLDAIIVMRAGDDMNLAGERAGEEECEWATCGEVEATGDARYMPT